MTYLTVEGKFRKIFGYHVAILNSIRNDEKVNIPLFLSKLLEKSIKVVKAGRGKVLLHQGLVKLLYQSAKEKGGVVRGFPRNSGTPISRAQLRLGATPKGKESPVSQSSMVLSESEDEDDSMGKDISKDLSKGDDVRSLKRKPPPQVMVTSLAKCSKRSSRLQQKSKEKPKILDFVDTSEEDKDRTNEDKEAETGKGVEESMPRTLPRRGLPMDPQGTFTILEELRCHLKIMNGIGGPLSSTCACNNLLALEITNYLKEVVSKLKEMGSIKSQAQLASTSKVKKKD
eukprot:Gb_34704 [translate_table: standard]